MNRALEAVWRISDCAGLLPALRCVRSRHLLVLVYHGVVADEHARKPWPHPNVVSISDFKQQMAELVLHYRPVSVADLRRWPGPASFGAKPAVLVTFDDGFENNLRNAAPLLTAMGIPAVFHICTGHIGNRRMLWPDEIQSQFLSWPDSTIPLPTGRLVQMPADRQARIGFAACAVEACKRIPHTTLNAYIERLRKRRQVTGTDEVHAFLSWDGVRELKKRGFEIGSHTVDHPILTQIPTETLTSQVSESKRHIEQQLGGECVCFAYPNGGFQDVSPAVVNAVRAAGYRFAFTVTGRLTARDGDRLMIDRVYVGNGCSMAEFRTRITGFYQALKSGRNWAAAAIPKKSAAEAGGVVSVVTRDLFTSI